MDSQSTRQGARERMQERHCGGCLEEPKRIAARSAETMAVKAAEKRLSSVTFIKQRIEDCRQERDELLSMGTSALRNSSMSVLYQSRHGVRLDPDELVKAKISELETRIAMDGYEVKRIDAAMCAIEGERYCEIIPMKYFEGKTDCRIAEELNCDNATVFRNRRRLLKKLALRLYGVNALDESFYVFIPGSAAAAEAIQREL